MRSFNFLAFVSDEKKEIVKIHQEVYSLGKSPNSPGSFGFKGTGKTNQKDL